LRDDVPYAAQIAGGGAEIQDGMRCAGRILSNSRRHRGRG
jgi:hypothetical protein